MFLAFWESIAIQRPQTRQISWHGVTQTFETMEAYDSCQVEEETMQSWLVMAHKPQAILSQATGIMADSFRMKTASDNNTLKVPNWRYSRYTWLTCSFLCHPLMLFYLVWPWMFVCVCYRCWGRSTVHGCCFIVLCVVFFCFLHLYACCLKTSGLYTACQDSSMDHMSYEPCQCELYLFSEEKTYSVKVRDILPLIKYDSYQQADWSRLKQHRGILHRQGTSVFWPCYLAEFLEAVYGWPFWIRFWRLIDHPSAALFCWNALNFGEAHGEHSSAFSNAESLASNWCTWSRNPIY